MQKGFAPILIVLIILLILSILGGVYYLGKFNNSNPFSIPFVTNPTTPPLSNSTKKEVANWLTYNMSDCLVTFNYPEEWQSNFTKKGACVIHYTQPPINSQPLDTFVIFDVQPDVFLGQQNIDLDQDHIISRSTSNGIEEIIEYSEEKDRNRPIYLSIKNYFFKKGSIYFRIVGQYEKGDKDFEGTLEKIANSVVINGDETFYTNYVKKLEEDLTSIAPN